MKWSSSWIKFENQTLFLLFILNLTCALHAWTCDCYLVQIWLIKCSGILCRTSFCQLMVQWDWEILESLKSWAGRENFKHFLIFLAFTQQIIKTRNFWFLPTSLMCSKLVFSTVELARTCIGTPYYLSPEIVENRPYNNKRLVFGTTGTYRISVDLTRHSHKSGSIDVDSRFFYSNKYMHFTVRSTLFEGIDYHNWHYF